jgi:small conductance mechanosensitive channel
LLTGTREISSGSLDTDIVFRLMRLSFKNSMGWLVKSGPGYLVKFILFVIILFAAVFIARIVRMGLDKALNAPNLKLSRLAHRMIVSTSSKLIILFGILIALSQWGISLGPLLAGLGIAGFIVGFALQGILGNFASGIMILLYRPFDVDDQIDVGGIFGKVEKMSLVSTSLLTVDNQLFIVPNSKIWGDVIKNETAQKFRRIDMVFGISYSDNILKAESILKEIVDSHELVLDSPSPVIHLHTLNESSVDFIVRPWVKADNYWEVYWDITRSVKLRFDEEGITIPFPQRDVHIHNHDAIAQQNL